MSFSDIIDSQEIISELFCGILDLEENKKPE